MASKVKQSKIDKKLKELKEKHEALIQEEQLKEEEEIDLTLTSDEEDDEDEFDLDLIPDEAPGVTHICFNDCHFYLS